MVIVLLVAGMLAMGQGMAGTAAGGSKVRFNVPRQSVDRALIAFAQQAQVPVLFPAEKFGRVMANRLAGEHSIAEGLQILLKDTGLTAELSPAGQIVVRIAEAARDALMGASRDDSHTSSSQPVRIVLEEVPNPRSTDVVVTAQRREEDLFDAPLTVSALTGDALERQNVRSMEDLVAITPGLQFEYAINGTRGEIQMRGISTADGSPGAENPAALHLDNVYIARRGGMGGFFFDLERIEVLHGPQGTLYGRNAAVGSINVISRRPRFETEGSAEIDAGSNGLFRYSGVLNVPLSQSLAIRTAFQTSRREGWYRSGLGDQNDRFARIGLHWNISDRSSLYIKGDVGHSQSRGQGQAILAGVDPVTRQLMSQAEDPFDDSLEHPPAGHPNDALRNFGLEFEMAGLMAEYTQDFGSARAIATVSYRWQEEDKAHGAFASNGRWIHAPLKGGTGIFDARLVSDTDGPLQWTAGLFYFDDRAPEDWRMMFNGNDPPEHYWIRYDLEHFRSDSRAVYAQGTYALLDDLAVTAGVRFTRDHKEWVFREYVGGIEAPRRPQDIVWTNTDYKLGVSYDLPAGLMLYANFATGFRSGSYYPGVFPYYDPEYVDAYELGIKGRLLENRLQLGLNTYYYDYQGLVQVLGIRYTDQFGLEQSLTSLTNAGLVEVNGADLSLSYMPTDHDQIDLTLEYNRPIIEEFDLSNTPIHFPGISNLRTDLNWGGLTAENAPPWKATLAYARDFRFNGGAELSTRAQVHWQAGRYMNYNEVEPYKVPAQYAKSFVQTDLQMHFTSSNGRWFAGAYVKNLFDEVIPSMLTEQRINNPRGPLPVGLYQVATLRAPRHFGIRLGARF